MSLDDLARYNSDVYIGPLLDLPVDHVKSVMDTNFFGFVRLCNAIVPRMAKSNHKGLIVAIGSILGEFGTPWTGIYNASKAALHSYTETLEMECRPLGVNVMLVAPGSIVSNIANVSTCLSDSIRTLSYRFSHPTERGKNRISRATSTFALQIIRIFNHACHVPVSEKGIWSHAYERFCEPTRRLHRWKGWKACCKTCQVCLDGRIDLDLCSVQVAA